MVNPLNHLFLFYINDMKIVYITPHLSTGGMPEYLRNKIELLKDENDIWVFEKTFEPAYRTVRDKIEKLIGDRLINLGSNLQKLPDMINLIKPDVIHFEELSDTHFTDFILDQIYRKDRTWSIIETLHDSSIDYKEKCYIPDKMIVVSPWQIKNFLDLNIPIEIINHDIVPGIRNRDILKDLSLDPSKKHILQVGLWSRRKNQSDTIEIARQLPDIQFHFVGSLTENYKDYWEPLLQNLPNNCKVWGERNDVDTFYKCMDMVIFPSKGDYGDRETNPLVIRESIAWKLPLLLRDLPVYMGMYNSGELVKFMSDDVKENKKIIEKMLDIRNERNTDEKMFDKDFLRKKLFDIKFEPNENNKIYFFYLEDRTFDVKVCIRDIDTEIPIYSFDAKFENKNSYWCYPIPIDYYDFKNNPNFGGFLFDFYVGGEKIYSMSNRLKRASIAKKKFRIETFDPVFVNYEQFFTDKIYDNFFNEIGDLESVVDIGANIGLFTELCLDKGARYVTSVEINQTAINTFNDLHGGKENVKLVTEAISDQIGEIEIFENPENSLVSSFYQQHTDGLTNMKVVKTITLDKLFVDNNINDLSLLKIDIEGAEYKAFNSLSDDNLKKIKFILLEFHDNFGNILREDILNRLESNGFTYQLYQDDCIGEAFEYEERGTIFAKR
jgi:FkbM family methyltransferase